MICFVLLVKIHSNSDVFNMFAPFQITNQVTILFITEKVEKTEKNKIPISNYAIQCKAESISYALIFLY